MESRWTQGLNPQQKKAVLHHQGPLLILAGAGSGKTTVLVSRTGQILESQKVKPENILVLTFTNKAARELKERVGLKLGQAGKKINAGTFHGFGLQFLKSQYKLAGLPQRFGILDATDSKGVIKELLKTKKYHLKESFDPDLLLKILSDKRSGKSLSPSYSEEYLDVAEWILPSYLSRLHSLGVVDFDGLLLTPKKILTKHPQVAAQYQEKFQYIMVDEFQDTNKIQLELTRLLCHSQQNLAVVGDDDQSIYGWRGAEIQNILSFPKLFKKCEVIRLETNYRSTPQILEVANAIIQKNPHRHEKVLKTHSPDLSGSQPEIFVYENEDEECDEVISQIHHFKQMGYEHKEMAILFRSNTQLTGLHPHR